MKKLVILLLILVSLLSGCTKDDEIHSVDVTDSDLHNSMKKFFQLKTCSTSTGNLFTLKLDPTIRIQAVGEFSDTEFFTYRLYLAPITDKSIRLSSIIFEFDDELEAYFKEKRKESGKIGIEDQDMLFQASTWYWKEKASLRAFSYRRTFSNLGNDLVLQQGWNLDEFANKMNTFKVKIYYNNEDVEIHTLGCSIIELVSDKEDINKDKQFIEDTFLDGKIRNSFEILD